MCRQQHGEQLLCHSAEGGAGTQGRGAEELCRGHSAGGQQHGGEVRGEGRRSGGGGCAIIF